MSRKFDDMCRDSASRLVEIIDRNRSFLFAERPGIMFRVIWMALYAAGSQNSETIFLAFSKQQRDAVASAYHIHIQNNPDMIVKFRILGENNLSDYSIIDIRYAARYIFCLSPDDCCDALMEQWRLFYYRCSDRYRIPAVYLWNAEDDVPEILREKLTKLHRGFECIGFHNAEIWCRPRIFYGSRKKFGSAFLPDNYWENASVHAAAVHGNMDAAVRIYAEASHRSGLPVAITYAQYKKSVLQKKNYQLVSRDINAEYCWPDKDYSHFVDIDACPGQWPGAIHCKNDGDNISGGKISLIATNHFSLLRLIAMCRCGRRSGKQSFGGYAGLLLRIWRVFVPLFEGRNVAFEHIAGFLGGDLASDLCRDWVRRRWIEPLYDSGRNVFAITCDGRRLFSAARDIHQYDILHDWAHPSVCETRNREYIGIIDSAFLRAPISSYFYVQGVFYHKYFNDVFAHHAVLAQSDAVSHPCWLDALPEFIDDDEARDIEKMLIGILKPESCDDSHDLDHEAIAEIEALRQRYVSAFGTDENCIHFEISPHAMQLWTFSGAAVNAVYAAVLETIAPDLDVSYGNLNLYLSRRGSHGDFNKADDRSFDIAAELVNFDRFGCPAFIDAWQKRHLYHWMMPLIPESIRKQMIGDDAAAYKKSLAGRRIVKHHVGDLFEIDIQWQNVPIADGDKNSGSTDDGSRDEIHLRQAGTELGMQSQTTGTVDADIHYKNHGTKPMPGIMHTIMPWYFIDTQVRFQRALTDLLTKKYIGLDVETTLMGQHLRLIQIGCSGYSYIIDPLKIDFSDLIQVMEHPGIIKLIHNASFEKRVLGHHQMQINNIIDTMNVSRKMFGSKDGGGHSLKMLCKRVFGLEMSKECQKSDWSVRPLTDCQLEYAALDAEILVRIYEKIVLRCI